MTKEKSGKNVRELTLDILYEILEEGAFSHVVLSQALSKYQYFEKSDRAFITQVTVGTLEYLIQIDFVLDQFSKTKTEKMKPLIRTLLRMSVYQILYMDRIPDSAVCNEAVKLAEKRRFQGLKGFVNGVLRTISREKENLTFSDDSIAFSMPSWILSLWKETYDQSVIRKMLTWFLSEKPMMVRLNTSLAKKEDIIKSLKDQEVLVKESPFLDTVLWLEGFDHIESLLAFQKGWLQVQDLSSCLVGLAANPQEGDVVLDVCGAPGGKALHIADLLKGTGHVQVRDVSEQKVNLINENIDRSGFSNLTAQVWDALVLDEAFLEKADIVLADLPCSGL